MRAEPTAACPVRECSCNRLLQPFIAMRRGGRPRARWRSAPTTSSSPGCAPRWVGCWGAAAGPVLAAHHGGLSGNITSWSLCGAPRIRRLQGMQIMVWHPVHHPANCCCAGPEADGQQEGAGGPHPAAPGHWTVAATVSTHTRVHLPCGSNESMRHPASIPSSVPKRRGAAPRFAPGLPACNFAAHTDSAACNVHVQSCKVLILPLNASSSWIA